MLASFLDSRSHLATHAGPAQLEAHCAGANTVGYVNFRATTVIMTSLQELGRVFPAESQRRSFIALPNQVINVSDVVNENGSRVWTHYFRNSDGKLVETSTDEVAAWDPRHPVPQINIDKYRSVASAIARATTGQSQQKPRFYCWVASSGADCAMFLCVAGDKAQWYPTYGMCIGQLHESSPRVLTPW